MLAVLPLLLLLPALGVFAVPAIRSAATVTNLTPAQISSFAPYTQFARAAYCNPLIVQGWQCGEACDAVPGFTATLTGGDGDTVQYYYVGYWSTQNTVVVAHQGTDPTQLVADLTDVDILMANPDPTLFPGLSSSIEVHQGFADEHAKTATTILAEVKRLLSQYGANSVTLVGHSLGGALAELDTLYMKLNLPSSVSIHAFTYGTPRVGNDAWAAYFDSQITDFKRINNEKDIVPIVPGRFLGFLHPAGEIHIVSADDVVACPGEDDATDAQCTIKTVPNIAEGDLLNHLGPYEGIYIGTVFCT